MVCLFRSSVGPLSWDWKTTLSEGKTLSCRSFTESTSRLIFSTRFECGFHLFSTRFECTYRNESNFVTLLWSAPLTNLLINIFIVLAEQRPVIFYTRNECSDTSSPLVSSVSWTHTNFVKHVSEFGVVLLPKTAFKQKYPAQCWPYLGQYDCKFP